MLPMRRYRERLSTASMMPCTDARSELLRTLSYAKSAQGWLAHPADAPHIDGRLRPFLPSPRMLERRPQMREVLERLEPVGVDEHLEDGDHL